jgi:hypothetical protein
MGVRLRRTHPRHHWSCHNPESAAFTGKINKLTFKLEPEQDAKAKR